MKRIIGIILASFAVIFAAASPASAHGEEAQEAWLRMNSVAWFDVKVDGAAPTAEDKVLKVGDEIKLSGSVKVLPSWPKTLADPEEAFVNVVVPGPVMLVKERKINGQLAPHSIYIERDGIYNFEITLQARIPGRYHVHPTFSVHGAGTLIGPGQWAQVEKSATPFKNMVTLYNGEEINLENYKVWWVFSWTFAGFILGMIWLLWWIWPKPTVSRLAVTSQLSVNDDGGPEVGLVTKRDLRAMDALALTTVLFVALGMIWQAQAFPVKMPLQVQRGRIDSAPQPVSFVTAKADDVILDNKTNTYGMSLTVQNTGTTPVTLNKVSIANFSLTPTGAGEQISPSADVPADSVAITQGSATVEPGQSVTLGLRLPRAQLSAAKLIPEQNANANVAALLEFGNGSGETQYVPVYKAMNTVFAGG